MQMIFEGLSRDTYKEKVFYYVDFSVLKKNKEKTLKLIKDVAVEYAKNPQNSVLAITNVKDFFFDMDVLKLFKETQNISSVYEKKVAVIGVAGLLKAAYNFVIGLTQSNHPVKIFATEIEAKEWLVQ